MTLWQKYNKTTFKKLEAKTLFDKIWDRHIVRSIENGPDVIYIDRHYLHEVTSPLAFNGLRQRGIKVFRPEKTIATADHNTPTKDQHLEIRDELSRNQVAKLDENCKEFGITYFGLNNPKNGIIHVIAPELGYTLPVSTLSKLNIRQCRVYLNAENLLTFTNYNNIDPEVRNTNDMQKGVDSINRMPLARIFSLGFNVTF